MLCQRNEILSRYNENIFWNNHTIAFWKLQNRIWPLGFGLNCILRKMKDGNTPLLGEKKSSFGTPLRFLGFLFSALILVQFILHKDRGNLFVTSNDWGSHGVKNVHSKIFMKKIAHKMIYTNPYFSNCLTVEHYTALQLKKSDFVFNLFVERGGWQEGP